LRRGSALLITHQSEDAKYKYVHARLFKQGAKVIGDGDLLRDTLTTMFDRSMSKGPGSQTSREETPSPSTIYRIEKAQEALEEEVGEEVGILTAGDELVCETCQEIADGGPYTLDEAEGLIPGHLNCLPGESLVSPAGMVTGAYERFYDGDLIVIQTAGGRELACTPNYPVLTDEGSVAARSLKVGGYVVSRRIVEGPGAVEADDEKVPARIEDVARAFLESGQTRLFKVPTARPDFHGDGTEGEIAVVGTNRLLSRDGDAALLEHLGEPSLDGRIVDGEQLACSGALDLHVEGVALAAPGNVGRPNLCGPRGGVHASPFDTLLFGRRAEFDAILCEQQSNRAALNIIRGCKPLSDLRKFRTPRLTAAGCTAPLVRTRAPARRRNRRVNRHPWRGLFARLAGTGSLRLGLREGAKRIRECVQQFATIKQLLTATELSTS
jgi:hypothetical protein